MKVDSAIGEEGNKVLYNVSERGRAMKEEEKK